MKATVLQHARRHQRAGAGLGDGRADDAADQRMRLLDGMPYHQVITFQTIAPTSAPKTTCWSTTPGSTMPLPTVAATLSWKTKIATTLKKAAKSHRLRAA